MINKHIRLMRCAVPHQRLFSLIVILVIAICLNGLAAYAQVNSKLTNTFKKNVVSASPDSNSRVNAGVLDAVPNLLFDSASGSVSDLELQPDGKILIGGYFRSVNGAARKSLIRLNADYTVDPSFSVMLNGAITTIARQTDGKILIGGSFETVNGVNRTRIARLNADGTLDATFNPGPGADALVYDIEVQPDGKILLGGLFGRVNTMINPFVTRLNTDGSNDTSFISSLRTPPIAPPGEIQPISSAVYDLDLQSDGRILVAGYVVIAYNGTNAVTTPVMRLTANGSLDSTFNSGATLGNGIASKISVQPDGKILLGGNFTMINQVRRNCVARLNADGTLDAAFDPGTGANFSVTAVYRQTDGNIVIAGRFTTFNGVTRAGLARLNANGALDENFTATGIASGNPQSVIALPNGKIIVGGTFTGFNLIGGSSVRFYNADGSLDASGVFNTTALGGVTAIAVQPDGKIIVGGTFTRVGGISRNGFARINVDGTLDENFGANTGFVSSGTQVNSIVIQPDGKILIAGFNIALGNTIGYVIARLNADGTVDNSFVPADLPISRGVAAIALQPDGKIILVWNFIRGAFSPPTGGAARLNVDGSLDSTFTLGIPGILFNSVALQSDGKIIVGFQGAFGYYNSQTGGVFYNGVARLNANGTHDRDFRPATASNFETGPVTSVYSVAVQTDGKILVGGNLFKAGSTTPTSVVRLNTTGMLDPTFDAGMISGITERPRVQSLELLPDGKILIGGSFTHIGDSPRVNFARLNADGTLDSSLVANTDSYSTVNLVKNQSNGKYLIGGDFETVNGTVRTSLARIASDAALRRSSFDFDGDGKSDISVFRPDNGSWYLQQSQNGFAGIAFGLSTDKLVPADYDGDGKTDVGVVRNGVWYLMRSAAGFTGITFGVADDVPVPADYDGDGKTDVAVFRPSNGYWYILQSSNNQFIATLFGISTDKPVPADYDGDGKTDIAVNRGGNWYLNRSQLGFIGIQFGDANDKSVPADYDGDGKADIAVFRPSNGAWYVLQSSAGFTGQTFGLGTDIPTPADYDGDGKTDLAVVRQGNWYLNRTTQGFVGIQFGTNTDLPIPNAFVK